MWKRLVKSSLLERLKKLEEMAYDLGISIQFGDEILLIDERDKKIYHFLDLEANVGDLESGDYVCEFPTQLEYKLCLEELD